MAISARFIEDIKSKVSFVELVGRRVKLIRRGKDYIGLCPFHHEKTPSFHVNEDKGVYHCFGCGAHGDALQFVMQVEKISFTDAIEQIAHLVGTNLPAPSPQEIQNNKKRLSLFEIMEKATCFYEQQLFRPIGKQALSYLQSRGLSNQDIQKFRLGYAPPGKSLKQHLIQNSSDEQDLLELGLVSKSKIGDENNYDYFRNRILFPIMDKKGRPIAFGGRVMDSSSEPKYLNSPETPLFRKGENLYAIYQSSTSIREKNSVLLVEGYMDVIALHKAGITNAVAPLGTALTEDQLNLLWKMAPEPIVCFDGDSAGQRASERAADRALPILKPGCSLRFVWLSEGLDPDEFLKLNGKASFLEQLKGSKSLFWLIWNRLIHSKHFGTPEKLALLEKETKEIAMQIKDSSVRNYYKKALTSNLKTFIKEQRYSKNSKKVMMPFVGITSMPTLSPLQSEAKMLLAYFVSYPEIVGKHLETLCSLNIPDKKVTRLLDILTSEFSKNDQITGKELEQILLNQYSKNIFIYLNTEIEILKRSTKAPEEIEQDMKTLLKALHISAIEEDIKKLMVQFSENNDQKLWQQILSLKQEKEKLRDNV